MSNHAQDLNTVHTASRRFCLIWSDTNAPATHAPCTGGGPGHGRDLPHTLLVPAGVSHLVSESGTPPRIVAGPPGASSTAQMLEPIRQNRHDRLLLVSPVEDGLMLNAAPAPRVAVLEEGDQIALFDVAVLLHVSSWVRPYVGPPDRELVGAPCSFCQVPVEGCSRVYVCPYCHRPLHEETETDRPETDKLLCARSTSSCPNCQNPIVAAEGLSYVPPGDEP